MANEKFEKALKAEIMKILLQLGYKIEGECKIRTPVISGHLRAGWNTEKKKNSVIVGNNVDYINHVEFLYDLPERDMWEAKRKRGGQLETTLPILRPTLLKCNKYLEEIVRKRR